MGGSDHPDPIQVFQAFLQVEIAHKLISIVWDWKLAGQTFEHVIGFGHSFGSIKSAGVVYRYPKDFDAVVLPGFSLSSSNFNSAIASQNQPAKFGCLPNGYLVVDSAISNQFAFFRYPNFDPASESLLYPLKVLLITVSSISRRNCWETNLYIWRSNHVGFSCKSNYHVH